MDQPFGDCKNEPLHNMGRIQPHGAFIAFNTADYTVAYCSENCRKILGIDPGQILGSSGPELFPDHWKVLVDPAQRRGIHNLPVGQFPTALDVALHQQGEYLIAEFEPAAGSEPHWWNHNERIEFLERLENTRSIVECRRLLVRYLFERTGFHRVMLYEFMPDMHGAVVEERVKPGIDSFNGLHFPAEDIPPNAQIFYTTNWQRLIADVDAEAAPIIGTTASPDQLDLTCSMLRAVHPVHLQYLTNMKVKASFSLSVLVKGKLYGLVACHHNDPRIINMADRRAYEEIARTVSIHLEHLLDISRRDIIEGMGQQLTEISSILTSSPSESGVGIAKHLGPMQELVGATAAWLRHDGENYYSGPVPDQDALEKLGRWFQSLPGHEVGGFTGLPPELSSDPSLCSKSCGVLYIPLDDENFLALLRPEIIQTITWAGKPPTGKEETLNPRSSFNAWAEQVRGTAAPWNDMELEFANKLRTILLAYVAQPTFE